jgi:hypothetical protein
VHVIAGFESQITARGGLSAIGRLARTLGADLGGAALARRDTEGAIHVDPLRGYEMPNHVLHVLDGVVDSTREAPRLDVGMTALVVSLGPTGCADDLARLVDPAVLEDEGAVWVTTVG